MSFIDEELDCFAGAAVHIGIDLIELGEGRYAVKEDEGDVIAFEGGEMIVGGGVGAQGGDDPVDAVILHRGNDLAFPVDIVPGLADEDVVFVVGGYLFDAVDGFGEEFLFQVGEDYADGGRLALFEEDGGLVGFVVQLLRQLLHPHFRPQADTRMVMEGPADGGDRHIELFGDLLDGGKLVFFHGTKIGLIFIRQAEGGLAVHPLAAGEVGEGDGRIAQFDRLLAEGGDGAPGCCVVDIHRRGRFSFDGFDEGMDDEEIHAAVACAFGIVAEPLP